MREAIIIIALLKPSKSPESCELYRPLFFINVDKILTKILANALLPQMLNLEQINLDSSLEDLWQITYAHYLLSLIR